MFYCCVNEGAEIGCDQKGYGNVNRRSFIKHCLAGGAAVGLGAYSWLYRRNAEENSGRGFSEQPACGGVKRCGGQDTLFGVASAKRTNAQSWTVTIMEPDYWVIGSERKKMAAGCRRTTAKWCCQSAPFWKICREPL